MPSLHCIVGTIRIEPWMRGVNGPVAGDSTLEQALAMLAGGQPAPGPTAEDAPANRLVGGRRRLRFTALAADLVVRADLTQLAAELEAEWDGINRLAS
jgi:hypothetical protein